MLCARSRRHRIVRRQFGARKVSKWTIFPSFTYAWNNMSTHTHNLTRLSVDKRRTDGNKQRQWAKDKETIRNVREPSENMDFTLNCLHAIAMQTDDVNWTLAKAKRWAQHFSFDVLAAAAAAAVEVVVAFPTSIFAVHSLFWFARFLLWFLLVVLSLWIVLFSITLFWKQREHVQCVCVCVCAGFGSVVEIEKIFC